ncbi:WYL domain-containing protein [Exiguobacterium mexicanum]
MPFLSRQLLAAGAEVEVVEPTELREMMREQAERLWNMYE